MVDVFLIVATVVAIVILLIIASYLLVYYQHPDDHNDAYVPKLIVLLGFVLAGATVLMLPLDVANNEGYAGKPRNPLFLVEILRRTEARLTSPVLPPSIC
jgi:LMBR1 domain-containing protein 1